MESLISKIASLSQENKALIQHIRDKETIITYHYEIELKQDANDKRYATTDAITCFVKENTDLKMHIIEKVTEFKVSDLIKNWHFALTLVPPALDLFNDNLNFEPKTLDEVANLNERMLILAHKYGYLGDSKKGLQEVSQLKLNLVQIQARLQELKEKLVDEPSRKQKLQGECDDLQKDIEKMNVRLSNMHAKHSLVLKTTPSQ